MIRKTNYLIFIFLFCGIAYSQIETSKYAISINGNYTTTSRLYLNPNSNDILLRNSYESLDDIYNYSIEIRYKIGANLFLAAGSEIIQKKHVNSSYNLAGVKAILTDGFQLIPVEITFYYELPFSSDRIKIFMGGGGGFYFGKHIREIGDVSVKSSIDKTAFGIHVTAGVDYFINEKLSLRTQMRFRDPEINFKNEYDRPTVNINGRSILLPTSSFHTKVNVDGITFTLGASYNFNLSF